MSVGEPAPAPAPARTYRPAQTALLEAVVADALDPAYSAAAERRRDRPPRARSATVALLVAGGLVLGLVLGRERLVAPSAEDARSALLGDARTRTATVDELSSRVDALRQETNALQVSVLDASRQGRALASRTADLETATAATAGARPRRRPTPGQRPRPSHGRNGGDRPRRRRDRGRRPRRGRRRHQFRTPAGRNRRPRPGHRP